MSDLLLERVNEKLSFAFEELNHEAFKALHGDHFKGLRVKYSAGFFDRKFFISSMMGPEAYHEFGAYYFHPKLVLVGKTTTDTLTARVKAKITESFVVKANAQLKNKKLNAIANLEYMVLNHRIQCQLGSSGLTGATYIQRVTPRISFGGEVVRASLPRKLDVGCALRYEDDKTIATAQGSSTGSILMTYVHKVSMKFFLATDFVVNMFSQDAKATAGFDYSFEQHRFRGKMDSDGGACALVELGMNTGLKFLVSASLDLKKKDRAIIGLGINFG